MCCFLRISSSPGGMVERLAVLQARIPLNLQEERCFGDIQLILVKVSLRLRLFSLHTQYKYEIKLASDCSNHYRDVGNEPKGIPCYCSMSSLPRTSKASTLNTHCNRTGHAETVPILQIKKTRFRLETKSPAQIT